LQCSAHVHTTDDADLDTSNRTLARSLHKTPEITLGRFECIVRRQGGRVESLLMMMMMGSGWQRRHPPDVMINSASGT
jgi:hypothetical protein